MESQAANSAPRDGEQLWQARCRYYRGSAKVALGQLRHSESCDYTLDEKNVRRLVDVFNTEGAQRLEPDHAVPALVSDHVLEASLQQMGITPTDASSTRQDAHPSTRRRCIIERSSRTPQIEGRGTVPDRGAGAVVGCRPVR